MTRTDRIISAVFLALVACMWLYLIFNFVEAL